MTLLTIAVPTIPGRESLLSRCLWSITEQMTDEVQCLVIPGPGLLGDKVNLAAQQAQGEYMTVVDDDDYLDGAYVASVLPLLREGFDYVGLRILQWIDDRFHGITETAGDVERMNRQTNHHGPSPKGITKRSLWLSEPMRNDYFADRWWMQAMARKITTHAFVPRALYIYDHHSTPNGWGASRDVGQWPYAPERVDRLPVP